MIKLVKVNKYFNRFKRNSNHVINNTSLEFGDTGLISILGNSGSGKTTLLNAIGGLDKLSSGKIYVNGKRINKRLSGTIDKVRNLNIGYIFQNYNLLNHLTVFENVSIALRMSGVKNKKEIEKRVHYILNVLGIYKYRHRKANMLSGGEKQRVAIARALVKNPKIIIADEPTGNLDSKNTLEIMNILKSISKDKLVILVTHEKNIAEFYASRIIEVVDGKIVDDRNNEHNDELDYRMDNKIYLKELENLEKFNKDNINLSVYSDNKDDIDIKLVVKNGNIYIESKYNRVEVVDQNSSIELVDDVYKKISKEEQNEYKFDYENIINPKYKMKYKSIYNPFTLILNGFKIVSNYSILKKIMLLGFVFSAMFVLYAVSNIRGISEIKEEEYIQTNPNYIKVIGKTTVDNYMNYLNLDSIDYILPKNSLISFFIQYNDYYQTSDAYDNISASLSNIDDITKDDLVYGRMPEAENEIVIDNMVYERMVSAYYSSTASLGFENASALLDRSISFKDPYNEGSTRYDLEYVIVGISDLSNPSVYAYSSQFTRILDNSMEGQTFDSNVYGMMYSQSSSNSDNLRGIYEITEDIVLEEGRMPEWDYEIIVHENLEDEFKLNKTIDKTINGNELIVVGYYSSQYNTTNYYTTENTILYKLIDNSTEINLYTNDKAEAVSYFQENNINVVDILENSKMMYISKVQDTINSNILVATIIIIISIIEIFLMLRASFLSRVKEVGILRAIGMKKIDIYKMFIGEIIAITTITAIPAIMFMSSILIGLSELSISGDLYKVDGITYIITVAIIVGVNIGFGLFPVFNVIQQTPAKILSKNNVD